MTLILMLTFLLSSQDATLLTKTNISFPNSFDVITRNKFTREGKEAINYFVIDGQSLKDGSVILATRKELFVYRKNLKPLVRILMEDNKTIHYFVYDEDREIFIVCFSDSNHKDKSPNNFFDFYSKYGRKLNSKPTRFSLGDRIVWLQSLYKLKDDIFVSRFGHKEMNGQRDPKVLVAIEFDSNTFSFEAISDPFDEQKGRRRLFRDNFNDRFFAHVDEGIFMVQQMEPHLHVYVHKEENGKLKFEKRASFMDLSLPNWESNIQFPDEVKRANPELKGYAYVRKWYYSMSRMESLRVVEDGLLLAYISPNEDPDQFLFNLNIVKLNKTPFEFKANYDNSVSIKGGKLLKGSGPVLVLQEEDFEKFVRYRLYQID